MLLANGVIRTLDPARPRVAELWIEGESVVEGGAGERIDLGGRCIVPGFTDSHVHFPTWALTRRQVRLEGTRTLEEALDRVARAARETPPGRWLRGFGWRAADWRPPTEPTRQALDAVTGDVPAALMARDYHSLWLNSAALARAKGDLRVPGGVVELDAAGEPTGVLREEAAWRFRDTAIETPDEEYLDAMGEALRVAARRGVIAVHDKDGWLGAPRLWRALAEREPLTLRVWQSVPHEQVGEARALGAGYLKAFMDGTLGSQTALMLDGGGVEITTREELEEIVRRGAEAGLPVAVHAIGDRANRSALDAFEATRDAWAPRGLRPRIEHAQCLAAEDLPRFAALGVAASVQFSHATSDRDLVERFWHDREERAYRFRSLLASGAVVANGSDAPIEELDPLAGIRAGVRRTIDARGPWRPEEGVTVEQALHATCVAPAWLSGEEDRRGRLVPGLAADLVVLDRDPVDDLDCRVVATMLAGRWVHNPPPWD